MAESATLDETTARVTELIASSDAMMWGHECAQILGEAIARADAAGLDRYAYAARMRLANNCSQIDDDETLLATFAVLEAQHSADPSRFPVNPGDMELPGLGYSYADLMWIYKWMPGVLTGNPEFSAADVEGAIDDMAAAYQRAGIPGKAITQVNLLWAINRGADADIAHWLEVVAATPTDDYGNCEACSRSLLIDAAIHLGDHERALAILDELIQGDFDCVEEPQDSYAKCLGIMADSGRQRELNIAIDAIMDDSFRLTDEPGTLCNMALFLVTTGDAPRALALVKRVLHCIGDNPLDQATHERQLAALAVVAGANEELSDRPLPEADNPSLYRYLGQEGAHTLRSAGGLARIAALDLSAAFDRRNGTDHHTVTTTAVLETVAGSRSAVTVALPPDAGLAFAETPHNELFPHDDAPRVHVESTDDAVMAVLNYAEMGRASDALVIMRDWLGRVDSPMPAAALLFAGALGCWAEDEAETAEELLTSCIASLEEAGESQLSQMLGELGTRALRRGRTDVGREDVNAALREWGAQGWPVGVRAVGLSLLEISRASRDYDDAWIQLLEEALQEPNASTRGPFWNGFVLRCAVSLAERSRGGERQLDPAATTLAGREHGFAVVANVSWRALSHLALTRNDDQAYDAATRSLLITQAWAGVKERAESAIHLLTVCVSQGRGSEILALNSYLASLTSLMEPRDSLIVHRIRAEALAGTGSLRGADAALGEAFEILARVGEEGQALEGSLLLQRAGVHEKSRRFNAALDDYLAAASACDAAGQDEDAMTSALGGARTSLRQGNSVQAGQLAELVISAIAALGGNVLALAEAKLILADAADRSLQDVDISRALYGDALAACGAIDEETANRYRLRLYEALAKTLWRADCRTEAAEAASTGLTVAVQHFEPSHEVPFRVMLGRLALSQGTHAEAATQGDALMADRYGETGTYEGERLKRHAANLAATSGSEESNQ